MQLSPAANHLIGATVNIATRHPANPTWLRFDGFLQASFTGDRQLTASSRLVDESWDIGGAPAHPGDWSRSVAAESTPALARAMSALQDAATGADLTRSSGTFTSAQDYAGVHLRFAARPVGLDHLRPYAERDGSWSVYVRTSLDDLFEDPQVLRIVDAARAVLAAARPAGVSSAA